MSDPGARERAAITVARVWIARDSDAAEPWIRRAAIPEEVKTRILRLRHEFPPAEQ